MFSLRRLAATFFALFACPLVARAQSISTDGSLGPRGTLLGPNYQIGAGLGTQNGANLFHSFRDFNINSGESATFFGPNSIQNILARVTGGNGSLINGALNSAIPNANLFLLNPNGIVFGQNAQLNVSGAFVASTADFVRLKDGGIFPTSATSGALLTSAPPTAFGFLGANPGFIRSVGANLFGAPKKSLSFIGGDVSLDNSILYAPGGRLNVVSVGSAGQVGFEAGKLGSKPDARGFSKMGTLDIFRSSLAAGDDPFGYDGFSGSSAQTGILLRSGDLVLERSLVGLRNGGAKNGGSLALESDGLALLTNSLVLSSAFGTGRGAQISVKAPLLVLEKEAGIRTGTLGAGVGGKVAVRAGNLRILDASQIVTQTQNAGNAGEIGIVADSILVDAKNARGVTSLGSSSTSSGKSGNLTIKSRGIRLQNGAFIASNAFESGDGGDISIKADSLKMDGTNTRLAAISDQLNGGKTGNINLQVGQLEIGPGAIVQITTGGGQSGTIQIRAEDITLNGGGRVAAIDASTFDAPVVGQQNGGTIDIQTGTLQVVNGGLIAANVRGRGAGGEIRIKADQTFIDAREASGRFNTGISAQVFAAAQARGADVNLDIKDLQILGPGEIATRTFGTGDGGSLTINADSVRFRGRPGAVAGIDSTNQGANNQAGQIVLNAGSVDLKNGAISSSTAGAGDAANVRLRVGDLKMGANSIITAATFGAGSGATVKIDAQTIRLTANQQGSAIISASTNGAFVPSGAQGGAGGNVIVRADTIVADGGNTGFNTGFSSESFTFNGQQGGAGGNVSVTARQSLRIVGGANISASTATDQNAGNVMVEAPEITLDGQGGKSGLITGVLALTNSRGRGGNITLDAQTLRIVDGGGISISTEGTGKGGNLDITAQTIEMDGRSDVAPTGIFAPTVAPDGGDGGDISVTAGALRMSNGATVTANSVGGGKSGNITLRVGDLEMNRGSSISAVAFGAGNGGTIQIEADTLRMKGDQTDAALISASTTGSFLPDGQKVGGKGGDVIIRANDIFLDGINGGSPVSITAESRRANGNQGGAGGSVNVTARNHLQLVGEAAISASTETDQNAGNITIQAKDVTFDGLGESGKSIDGSGVFAVTTPDSRGQGGNIALNAENLRIVNGGAIAATTRGTGRGGSITVEANTIEMDGRDGDFLTGIFAPTTAANGGDGGDISVTARDILNMSRGATISANSVGGGKGGNIAVAGRAIQLDNGQIAAASTQSGSAGSVAVEAEETLRLVNQSLISTLAENADGGNVSATAGDAITLENSAISGSAAGNGGNLDLRAARLIGLKNSRLDAQAGNNGGNITIDPQFVVLDKSQLRADAILGNGGNIFISANVFLSSFDSVISASSQFGVAGNIEVLAPNTIAGASLIQLPNDPLSAENYLQQRCVLQRGRSSSFVLGRMGAVPPTPSTFSPSLGVK